MAQSIWNEVINTFLHSRDFSGGSPLYFDIKDTSNPNYNIVQTSIESQTNKIYNELKGLKGSENSKLLDTLKREKDKSMGEDEIKRGYDDVQKLTDKFIEKIDELVAHKESELMKI